MYKFFLTLPMLLLLLLLTGCTATPVKDVKNIRTKELLDPSISAPYAFPVVYYVTKNDPGERKVNFWGLLEKAIDLVGPGYFTEVSKLSENSTAQYLLVFETEAVWNNAWGNWKISLTTDVISPDGTSIYKTETSKTSSGAGPYDYDAIYNGLAKAVKESLISFLNSTDQPQLAALESREPVKINPRKLLKNEKPAGSGSGFFIAPNGVALTAAHVVKNCIFLESQYKGEKFPATVVKSSDILDLAVIDIDVNGSKTVAIKPQSNKPILGQQIFVTGYPLANLLSAYPSLTVGNISSLGGLKGGQGVFQFSAPVQPGNSGGPVVDYKGNLVGVVTSTLNQAMLLEKTGNLSQNLNFAVDVELVKKFLQKEGFSYPTSISNENFEAASAQAIDYSTQIFCYQ